MELSLAELAERSGIPARTIRYYISQRLVDGPVQAGRGAHYTESHLSRLGEISRLRGQGLSLAEIGAEVAGRRGALPEPEGVWRYPVAPGVTVEVRSGLPPWQLRRIQRLIAGLAAGLAADDKTNPFETQNEE